MKTAILFLLISQCFFSWGQQTSLQKSGYRGNVKHIVTIKDSVMVSKLSYDAQGNLIEEINFEDSTTTKYINTYQGKNLVAKESELIVEGRCHLSKTTYDDLGTKIVKSYIDTNQTKVTILQYDVHFNMVEKKVYENGVRVAWVKNSYNDNNRLVGQVITRRDSTLYQSTTFNYTAAGYLIESHTKTYSSQSGIISQSDYYYENSIDRDRIKFYVNDSIGNHIRKKNVGNVRSGDIYALIDVTLKELKSTHPIQFDKKGRPLLYFQSQLETSNINYRTRLNNNKNRMIDEITITKNEYDETYFPYCGETKLKILYEKKKMVGSISYFNGLKTGEETYIASYNRAKQLDSLSINNDKHQYDYYFNYWYNGELKELEAYNTYNKHSVEPQTIKLYNSDGLLEYHFDQAYYRFYLYDSRGNCIYIKRKDVGYLEQVREEKREIQYY